MTIAIKKNHQTRTFPKKVTEPPTANEIRDHYFSLTQEQVNSMGAEKYWRDAGMKKGGRAVQKDRSIDWRASQPCFFWNHNGECVHGDECVYWHNEHELAYTQPSPNKLSIEDTSDSGSVEVGLCENFYVNGACYDAGCAASHDKTITKAEFLAAFPTEQYPGIDAIKEYVYEPTEVVDVTNDFPPLSDVTETKPQPVQTESVAWTKRVKPSQTNGVQVSPVQAVQTNGVQIPAIPLPSFSVAPPPPSHTDMHMAQLMAQVNQLMTANLNLTNMVMSFSQRLAAVESRR